MSDLYQPGLPARASGRLLGPPSGFRADSTQRPRSCILSGADSRPSLPVGIFVFSRLRRGPEKRAMFINELRDRLGTEKLLRPVATEVELFNTVTQQTINDTLPVTERRRKCWFAANADRIIALVHQRNRPQEEFGILSPVQKSSAGANDRLRIARRDVKRMVEKAKTSGASLFFRRRRNESNLQNGF